MYRRLISFLFTLMLLCCLCACGKPETINAALADWYASEARISLEENTNNTCREGGLEFHVAIEQPDTIVYIYQYTEYVSDESTLEEDYNYFLEGLEEMHGSFSRMIQTLNEAYHMSLTTVRVIYLDAAGTELCNLDFTED